MKIFRLFVICLTLLAVSHLGMSQNADTTKQTTKKPAKAFDTWSLSLHGGALQFFGDISDQDYPFPSKGKGSAISLGGHISLNKQFTRYFGAQAQFLMGSINSEKKNANIYFESSLFSYNLNTVLSTSNLLFPAKSNKWIDHYIIVGMGMTHYRTLKYNFSNDTIMNFEGYKDNGLTEDKMNMEVTMNIGTGLRFKLSDRLDLGIETCVKTTTGDDLDAHSNVYTEKDFYGYTTIGLTYKFGKAKKTYIWDKKDETGEIIDAIDETNKKLDSLSNLLNSLSDNVATLMNEYEAEHGPDADNDSIPDYRDVEPNTVEGALVDAQGRAIPNCCDPSKPNYKPVTAGSGGVTSGGGGLGAGSALYSVFFGLNSTYITPLNQERVAMAAAMMKRNPNMKFELIGYSCSLSSNQYNIELSKRRVDMVRDILVNEYGIDAGRLVIKYEGEEKPLNITDKNKYLNRRVDIFIVK